VTKRTQTIMKKNLKLKIQDDDEEDEDEATHRKEEKKVLSSDDIESHISFESSNSVDKKNANSEEMTKPIKEITYEEPKALQQKLTKMKQMRKPTLKSVFSDGAERVKPKAPTKSDEDLVPKLTPEPKRHPGKLSRFFQRGSSSLS